MFSDMKLKTKEKCRYRQSNKERILSNKHRQENVNSNKAKRFSRIKKGEICKKKKKG